MGEAPERIYLDGDVEAGDGIFPRCFENPKYVSEPPVEYVRADRIEQLEAKLAKAQSALKRIARTKPHFAGGTPNEHFMRTWAKEALADSQN